MVWCHTRTYRQVRQVAVTVAYPITMLTSISKIAAHLAESTPKEKTIVIDAFAGVGGNAIALARSGRWEQVFAIERDPKTMKCAKHNAKVYEVDKKIVWITGDCFDVIKRRFGGKSNIVIFASPPWGGELHTNGNLVGCANQDRDGV
jgi:tRNA/tmRNA/rRNA uracil-C5-methylase (TrmA/RlmC/RlmD family)